MTDTESLIKGCIAGNRSCQSDLYRLYSPKMMITALRYARRKEEAEDILQESFLKVYKAISQYKNTGPLEGWLRKIVVNTALAYYRSKVHLNPVLNIEMVENESDFANNVMDNVNVKDLLKMVQALPAAYRLVFNLYVFDGYKHKEIAELLGITEGTSKSNLHDARNLLQRSLNNSKTAAR